MMQNGSCSVLPLARRLLPSRLLLESLRCCCCCHCSAVLMLLVPVLLLLALEIPPLLLGAGLLLLLEEAHLHNRLTGGACVPTGRRHSGWWRTWCCSTLGCDILDGFD